MIYVNELRAFATTAAPLSRKSSNSGSSPFTSCRSSRKLLVSYLVWWMIYRTGASIADTANVEVACTKHCGGVDGPFLVALIGSGVVASIGLLVIVAGVVARRA